MAKPEKKEIKASDLGDLHSKEVQLLYYLRNRFRYGDVVIKMRDGVPYRLEKVTEFEVLD